MNGNPCSHQDLPGISYLHHGLLSCNLNRVTALLSSGADVKAVDVHGNEALTFDSTQRTKDMLLQCPDVVSTLQ